MNRSDYINPDNFHFRPNTHISAPISKDPNHIICQIGGAKNQREKQHFVYNRRGGGITLVLASLLWVQRKPSTKLYGKRNKTDHAQYETCWHLAPYKLIQMTLFMLFHYHILILLPQMLSFIVEPCTHLFFIWK